MNRPDYMLGDMRVAERDDDVFTIAISNFGQAAKDHGLEEIESVRITQPLDYVQEPGVLRNWHGVLGVLIAFLGAFAFGWVIWCVLARIFT